MKCLHAYLDIAPNGRWFLTQCGRWCLKWEFAANYEAITCPKCLAVLQELEQLAP
jgi:hypothetical protein